MRRALSTLLIAAGAVVIAAAPASADPVALPMPITEQRAARQGTAERR